MKSNSEKQDVAQPGQMYDTSPHLIISVENTSDTLEFGDFVVNDSGLIVKWNSDDYSDKKPVGVILYNALEIEGSPSPNSKIPLISRGTVWLSVDELDAGFVNVKKGNPAYLNAVNGETTGFIDDIITNQKIGLFLEDPSELNEGGYLAPIELNLFADNIDNRITVESDINDPPLPASGSIIYYNETDSSLRSSSASGYSYLNPKPYASVSENIGGIGYNISNTNEIPVGVSDTNEDTHLCTINGSGFQFTGSYPTRMHITAGFYANLSPAGSITISAKINNSQTLAPSIGEYYLEPQGPDLNTPKRVILDFVVLMNPQDILQLFIISNSMTSEESSILTDGYELTAVAI
jgi:hypothetical protein